jgi:hypothetical protein
VGETLDFQESSQTEKQLGPARKGLKHIVSTTTILIPVHDPEGKYETFLTQALDSILLQNKIPDQVLLVANHPLSYLENLLKKTEKRLNLEFKQSAAQSAAENINFGVGLASGEYIKLLFQDDLLNGSGSFESSIRYLEQGKYSWAVTGSQDWEDDSGKMLRWRYPKFGESLRSGINRVGAPSVASFRKSEFIEMNPQLKYMFDCDWYLRMAHRHGSPKQVREIGVLIRIHGGQATSWAKSLLSKEKRVVKKAHYRSWGLFPAFDNRKCTCVEFYDRA